MFKRMTIVMVRVDFQISQDFEAPLCPDSDTSLGQLVAAGLFNFLSRVEEVSATATKELALEESLDRMKDEWKEVRFEFLPYRYIILA